MIPSLPPSLPPYLDQGRTPLLGMWFFYLSNSCLILFGLGHDFLEYFVRDLVREGGREGGRARVECRLYTLFISSPYSREEGKEGGVSVLHLSSGRLVLFGLRHDFLEYFVKHLGREGGGKGGREGG